MSDSTSSRTSLERVQRKIVNEAADELVAFLRNMPEHGAGDAQAEDATITREKTMAAMAAIDAYLGGS